MTSESPGLDNIGQIALTIDSVDESLRFYGDTLGMKLIFSFDRMAFLDCGSVGLMLSLPEADGTRGGSVVYFSVPDITEAFASLKSNGVKFNGKPHVVHEDAVHELWMTFFHDPSGNQLALMSEVPKT